MKTQLDAFLPPSVTTMICNAILIGPLNVTSSYPFWKILVKFLYLQFTKFHNHTSWVFAFFTVLSAFSIYNL